MMVHHTKDKGDLGTIKAIADLAQKGFIIFTPLVCEHLPFDFIGLKDNKYFRFQSKYRSDGFVSSKTVWSDKNGAHTTMYSINDFDYYAIYLPDKDVVCYPSIKFAGIKITTTVPNSPTPFYWYEDFLDLTETAEKKTYRDFDIELTKTEKSISTSPSKLVFRKVNRPSKEELTQLIWSKPMKDIATDFSVSDKAIAKWAKSYGITLPGRGYWTLHPKRDSNSRLEN